MKRLIVYYLLQSLWIVIAGLFLSCQKVSKGTPRPNIVLIMADDLGFSDLGCYGGEINTPNLDKLASGGLKFLQFYNTSRCCPTRASLLTGLYNHSAGIGLMTTDQGVDGYRGRLSKSAVTIAEVLKTAGYNTGMTGKWHVSNTIVRKDPKEQLQWLNHQAYYPRFSPIEQYPTSRGFDRYFGNIWGVVDFFDPFSLVSGTTPVKEVPDNYYHTDAINDTTSAYIREFSKSDEPFFLYVAHTAPHWPLHALPEDIQKYEDVYKVGWEEIRQARYKKMVESGLLDSAIYPLTERYENDLKWKDNPTKEWDSRAMAVHAAMVDRMDQGIGRIVETLRETGELENTLILFLSDNGASSEDCRQFGAGFDRPGQTRDGKEIVYPLNKEVLPGPQTTFTSIGERWANVSNTPFRYWKMESFEGGTHTPLIAYWPNGITRPVDGTVDQVGHVIDIMATIVDVANAQYPQEYNGTPIKPVQGKSLKPIFKGMSGEGHQYIFNEHRERRSVRTQKWKMVTRDLNGPIELYDMANDRTEKYNVADQYSEVVSTLDSLWYEWAKKNNVLTLPNKSSR